MGAGGVAALAGCIGDDDAEADDPDDIDGDDSSDATDENDVDANGLEFVDQVIHAPSPVSWGEEEENLNNWAPVIDHYPEVAARYLMTEMSYRHPQTLERVPGVVTDWEFDDYEIIGHFHEDAYYSNGELLDPADYAYSLYNWNLVWGLEFPHGEFGRDRLQVAVEDFEVDGRTLILKSPNGYFENLHSPTRDPPAYFWDFYTAQPPWAMANFRELNEELWYLTHEVGLWHPDEPKPEATQDQMDRGREIQRELFTKRLPIDQAITNGPFKFDQAGEGELHLVPHDGWPWADQINWEGVKLQWMEEPAVIHAALRTDNLDAIDHVDTPPHVADAFPDHIHAVQTPTDLMDMLVMNQHHNWFDDVRVRQALAYAVDRGEIARTIHETARVPFDWHQIVNEETVEWEDPSDFQHLKWAVDEFERYHQDQDRAVSLLQDAGFERDSDDQWLTPDGDEWGFTIHTSAGNINFEQALGSAYDQFGIDSDFYSNEEIAFSNSFWNGEYETARYPGNWFRRHMNNIWHGCAVDHEWNEAFGPFGEVDAILEDLGIQPDADSGRYHATDERAQYDDLLALHRDRDLPVLTMEYDINEPWQYTLHEWTPDEFEANEMDPAWLEFYSAQLTARLTIEAPPVGEPDGNLLDWAPEFPTIGSDAPLSPPDSEDPEELELMGATVEDAQKMGELTTIAPHWVANYTLPALPMAWHTSQGFVNTRDWHWDEQYVLGPQHFNAGDTVSQLGVQANPDGRAG